MVLTATLLVVRAGIDHDVGVQSVGYHLDDFQVLSTVQDSFERTNNDLECSYVLPVR